MLESFKTVLDKEKEAEKIRLEAREHAKKIEMDAQEKAMEVYIDTYQEIITKAKLKTIEIKKQAKTEAESELQTFIKQAEKQKDEIRIKALKKFDDAVDAVLNLVLS